MIIMWLLGLALLYLLVGITLVKLIQLYGKKEGVEKKEDFYWCIVLWPIILGIFVDDWFFNLGKKK